MAAIVQHRGASSDAATSVDLAFASDNSVGNLLVYWTGDGGGGNATTAATDTNGNTIADINSVSNNTRGDYVAQAVAGANTVTGHTGGTRPRLHIWEFSGNTSAPLDQTGVTSSTSGSVSTSAPVSQDAEIICSVFLDASGGVPSLTADGSANASELLVVIGSMLSQAKIVSNASGVQTMTCGGNGADVLQQVIGTFLAIPPTVTQNSYRFKDDSADESGAGWLADENTSITRAINLNTRLRILVNTQSDIPTKMFQLEYRKQGSTAWHKVGE